MVDRQREIMEAIRAADDALLHLNEAQGRLKSAGNWGVADMLGGGFITTMMKHGNMNNARDALASARSALQRFALELNDVDGLTDVDLCTSDFLGFADLFIDGVIVDWLMQRRIGDARRQVEEAIRRVQVLRGQLQGMMGV